MRQLISYVLAEELLHAARTTQGFNRNLHLLTNLSIDSYHGYTDSVISTKECKQKLIDIQITRIKLLNKALPVVETSEFYFLSSLLSGDESEFLEMILNNIGDITQFDEETEELLIQWGREIIDENLSIALDQDPVVNQDIYNCATQLEEISGGNRLPKMVSDLALDIPYLLDLLPNGSYSIERKPIDDVDFISRFQKVSEQILRWYHSGELNDFPSIIDKEQVVESSDEDKLKKRIAEEINVPIKTDPTMVPAIPLLDIPAARLTQTISPDELTQVPDVDEPVDYIINLVNRSSLFVSGVKFDYGGDFSHLYLNPKLAGGNFQWMEKNDRLDYICFPWESPVNFGNLWLNHLFWDGLIEELIQYSIGESDEIVCPFKNVQGFYLPSELSPDLDCLHGSDWHKNYDMFGDLMSHDPLDEVQEKKDDFQAIEVSSEKEMRRIYDELEQHRNCLNHP